MEPDTEYTIQEASAKLGGKRRSVAPALPSITTRSLRVLARPPPERGEVIKPSPFREPMRNRLGPHLAPLRRGEVAASLRFAGAAAGEGTLRDPQVSDSTPQGAPRRGKAAAF